MNNELKISEILKELGTPADLLGYHYLKYAVELMLQDMSLMKSITKKLYPMIAKKFNTTCSRVERTIRHAIEVACEKGNIQLHHKLFGFTIDPNKCKPTNSEFIVTVVDWLNMNEAKESDQNAR